MKFHEFHEIWWNPFLDFTSSTFHCTYDFTVERWFLVNTVFIPYIMDPIYDPHIPIYGSYMGTPIIAQILPNPRMYDTHKCHELCKHVIIVIIYINSEIFWHFQKIIIFAIFSHFLTDTCFCHIFCKYVVSAVHLI